MRAIDTNILLRIVTHDDPRQARAAADCVAKGAWVSHVVFAETAWLLTSLYGLSRTALADVLSKLLDHVSIVIQEADVVEAALDLYRANKKVEFADCLLLEVARKAGHAPVSTFDRALAKVDGVELIV